MNHYNCIYMYVNKVNGHKYVGQAKDLNRRCREHISESRSKNKRKYNYQLSKAVRKYGIENFEIIILKENLQSQCLLNLYECYYIKKYNCLSKENYNIADGGHNGNTYAGKTEEEMDEIRKKISIANSGENNPMYGKCGENNPFYRKKHSKESKQKMSISRQGKKRSEKSKQKQHEVWKNKTEEEMKKFRNKISIAQRIKIKQEDKQGNLIKIWDGICETAVETGISSGNISICCQFWRMNCNREEWFKTHKYKPQKTAGGFIWKYYTEEDE